MRTKVNKKGLSSSNFKQEVISDFITPQTANHKIRNNYSSTKHPHYQNLFMLTIIHQTNEIWNCIENVLQFTRIFELAVNSYNY